MARFDLRGWREVVDSGGSMIIMGVPSVTNSIKADEAVVVVVVVVVAVVVVAVVEVVVVDLAVVAVGLMNGLTTVEGRTGMKLVVEGG